MTFALVYLLGMMVVDQTLRRHHINEFSDWVDRAVVMCVILLWPLAILYAIGVNSFDIYEMRRRATGARPMSQRLLSAILNRRVK